ncbi:MAG TPA: glycosyltransferase, partial [Bacilli bacterium]|nr:glycosyltransferase [Bacilli bacterium]
MKKFKVIVYAICKNEEKFVDRWYESMKEADEIYVLDTGSTDNTVEKLRKHNITVEISNIKPWRFDVARNISLDMVSTDVDICVCTDLDEVFFFYTFSNSLRHPLT